jgi:hypothetical protein
MGGLGGVGVEDHADGGVLGVGRNKRAQHARGIGVATRAGVVLGVGDDHGSVRAGVRDGHRAGNSVIGRQHLAVEGVLLSRN